MHAKQLQKRFVVTQFIHSEVFYQQVSDKLVEAFDKKSLENVTSFIDFYHGHGQMLNKELFTAKEKIKEMEDEIKMIDDRLSELNPLEQTEESSYDDKYVQINLFN